MAKRYKWTEKESIEVRTMAKVGVPHHDMCVLLGHISIKTLLKVYRKELDEGAAECHYNLGRKIYSMAMNGDKAMLCFAAKCLMGWRETNVVQNQTLGKDGKPIEPIKEKKYIVTREEAEPIRKDLDARI